MRARWTRACARGRRARRKLPTNSQAASGRTRPFRSWRPCGRPPKARSGSWTSLTSSWCAAGARSPTTTGVCPYRGAVAGAATWDRRSAGCVQPQNGDTHRHRQRSQQSDAAVCAHHAPRVDVRVIPAAEEGGGGRGRGQTGGQQNAWPAHSVVGCGEYTVRPGLAAVPKPRPRSRT